MSDKGRDTAFRARDLAMTNRLLCTAAILAALGVSTQQAGAQASFDCSKARAGVERAICRDPALSALDRRVAAAYSAALKRLDATTQKLLREDQRLVVASRDAGFGHQDFSLREYLEYRAVQLESIDGNPRRGFAGVWINMGGSVKVEADSKGLSVSVSASDGTIGRWVCEFEGVGRPDGADLVVGEPEGETEYDGWTLRLKRVGLAVAVEAIAPAGADAPAPFCGANGSVDGTYVAARGTE
jgi:uncharacterized protein